MGKRLRAVGQFFRDSFNDNGDKATIGIVLATLFVGISVVDDASKWWMIPMLALAVIVIPVILINVKVLVKSIVVSITTIVFSSLAFFAGTPLDGKGIAGLTWMFSLFASMFTLLTISYLVQTEKSRWNAVFVSQVVSFMASWSFVMTGMNVNIGVLVGTTIGFFVFFLLYLLPSTRKVKNMPVFIQDYVFNSSETWNVRKTTYKHANEFIAWNDKHAYMVVPVSMNEPFAQYKRGYLTYNGKKINKWLSRLIFRRTPVWTSRNADITLVLLDVNRKNGKQVKVIGVPIPDSKKSMPVIVAPADKDGDTHSVLTDIDSYLDGKMVKEELTDKQKQALANIGVE